MTLTEFETMTVDRLQMVQTANNLHLMSVTTKDGMIHNFFLPNNIEVLNEAHS